MSKGTVERVAGPVPVRSMAKGNVRAVARSAEPAAGRPSPSPDGPFSRAHRPGEAVPGDGRTPPTVAPIN
ncbi:hypothetical protein [Actinomadura sp. WMMB 499]|uniref:hypothetical protein n=1 Tax=Actinomadura sp. WMMB 499 TaxID=1219491 RepID=UPI001243C536|nr:hypothetical protein [Actinomadura sp. WMMB 499]QFG23148.1 hypothetical protein F7P10_20505 [Actinomadura sp. WMMB 499]